MAGEASASAPTDRSVPPRRNRDVIREMMRIPFYPLSLVLLLAASVMGKQPAPGERNAIVRPTIAMDAAAQVSRGGDVEITLNAIPSYGNMETFLIQTPPAHGTVTEPKSSSDHTATVVYHHDGTRIPLSDAFTFRVKAPAQAFSAPATVHVKIAPLPPRLVFRPDAVDFGNVFLGEKVRTNVVLMNLGGSKASGRLLLQGRFSLPNGERYHLEEGESLRIPIEFSPMEVRRYEERGIIPPASQGGGASLLLCGQGVPRFEVSAAEGSGGGGGQGDASWNVRNLSGTPLRISCLPADTTGLKGGALGGWILPAPTLIPPNSATNLFLQQEENEGASSVFVTLPKIRITDGLTESLVELPPPRRFIPVGIHPAPAPEQLLLGGSLSLSFTLLNRSDLPKRLSWKITSALGGGMKQPAQLELRGGESKVIEYVWKPSLPGEDALHLVVDEVQKTHEERFWRVVVIRETASLRTPVTTPQEQKSAEPPPAAMDSQENRVEPPGIPAETSIPQIDGAAAEVSMPWFGSPRVVFRWDGGNGSNAPIRIQECLLVPKAGAVLPSGVVAEGILSSMNLKLQDLRAQPIKSHDGVEKVIISGLSPGTHLILLSRLSSDGKPEGRTRLAVFVPTQPGWWGFLRAPLAILAIVLLLFFLRRIRRAGR